MHQSSLNILLYRMRKPFLVLVLTFSISIIGLLIIDGVDNNGEVYKLTIFDAFYFVTYTATTIGFGETPYAFTYSQRLWVSFTVYLSVLGWFYSIGTLISIFQDKLFLTELARGKFGRQIKALEEKYIIVLGYNHTTNEIIKRVLPKGYRVVVIEKEEQRANQLHFEGHVPTIPVLVADAFNSQVFIEAGIESKYCKAVVSLFEDDDLNLRVSLAAKLLNKNVILAVKSTSEQHTSNLKDLGVNIIKNPFKIVSSHMELAIKSPNLLKLERWLHKQGGLDLPITEFPKGKYIVCGYGRLGKYIYKMLKANNIDITFIEVNDKGMDKVPGKKQDHVIIDDADDKKVLKRAGIEDADVLIAGTDNDTKNLSILATARRLNPKILTITRENELDDFSIFHNAKIDYLFIPENTLINNISNALINPLTDKLVNQILLQDETWGRSLVKRIIQEINPNPIVHTVTINEKETPEIFRELKKSDIKLSLFYISLYDHTETNNIIPLLLYRDGNYTLLPAWDILLQKDDELLFACDENGKNHMEYISENFFEFYYAYTGYEKKTIKRRRKMI
ncbi:MAG: NAD-binding protein [Campylobacterota bacterium]|nr:NAD-binding protein [Campylobacterota bacterium]